MEVYLVFHGFCCIFALNQFLFPWRNKDIEMLKGLKTFDNWQIKLHYLNYNWQNLATPIWLVAIFMPLLFLVTCFYIRRLRRISDTIEIIELYQHGIYIYRIGCKYYYNNKEYSSLMDIIKEELLH